MRLPKLHGDVARLALSNVFNNTVTFITGFLIAANVSTESFGVYSVALNVAMVIFSIGELGMGISIVRSYNQTTLEDVRRNVLLAGMSIKLIISVILITISFPLGWLLSNVLSPEYPIKQELMLAVVCASVLGLWSFVRIMYQAKQDYRPYAGLTLSYGLVRLILVGLLFLAGIQTAAYYLVALYLLGPLLVAGISFYRFVSKMSLRIDAIVICQVKSLLSYGKWVLIGNILYPLCFSLPLFLIMRIDGPGMAAEFAVGLMFVAIIAPFNDAMRAFVLPKVTGFQCATDAKKYISKIRRFFLPYLASLLIVLVACGFVHELFLGEKYPDSLLNIEILMFASGLTVFGGILNIVAHYLSLPHLDAWVNIGRILFIFTLGSFVIPIFGALGAALITATALILGEIVSFVYINRKLAGAM